MDSKKIFMIFAAFNLAVFVFAGLVFFAPAVNSLRNGRASVRLLERRYVSEQRFAAEFEENLLELEEIRAARTVLAYDEILPALGNITRLGAANGLVNAEFLAEEVSAGFFAEGRFYEKRVRAVYEGVFFDFHAFLHELPGARANIRSFSIYSDASDIMEEISRLRIEFSLVGG